MVEIPFTILITFVIISFFMIVFGLFTRRIFGVYYMGTVIIVLTGVIWITLFAQVDTVSGTDSNFNITTSSIPIIVDHMNQQTSNTETEMTTLTFSGQRVDNDNSLLALKEINSITLRLDKDGLPTGNVYVGIWSRADIPTATNYRFLTGQMLATHISATIANYQFTRNDTKTYLLQPLDVAGILSTGGTGGNSIAIFSNTTASSFDGGNSYCASVTSGIWADTTTCDRRMKISLIKNNIQELNNSDKYDFNSIVKIYVVFFGVIIILTGGIYQLNGQRDKR